ncbi:DUF2802 domain-containing protein [Methylobacter tundripaludum]|uniref:DUF2802 domain-containing protein n=1 Tax=Methylobacter tundripaludum TaxID=173365 RepID=UPI0004DF2500|nr:DUF2802 domain-containing protein [Methylobacter tundripaludum]
MNNLVMVALIIEGITIVVMLVVLFWLVRTQLRLKHDYQVLNDIVHGNSNDIAGLCSAALTVDSRIATVDSRIAVTDGQIDDLAAKIAEVEQNDQSSHPYSGDIRKVRSGASVNELMKNSGLSHDEAALLIRLHGSKTPP